MSERLLGLYERELAFLRHQAQDFARRYPAAAGRLLLEPNRCDDPHVERLIEAVALLAARVQHKIDDEFPELTDALLGVLHPHYLAPVPSMAIVQFVLDPGRGQVPDGFAIPAWSRLRTRPVRDLPCKFRTAYPVTLWPLNLTEARLLLPPFAPEVRPAPGTRGVLVLRLDAAGPLPLRDLTLESLRLYLDGAPELIAELYELIFNHATGIEVRPVAGGEGTAFRLEPGEALAPVGFADDEALLPTPPHAFAGYRLLSEYFAFAPKFHFVDVRGLGRLRGARFGRSAEVHIALDRVSERLAHEINAKTFRTGCTPIVNLFAQTAEPINLDHTQHEYRVVPDVAHADGMEVYAIDSVVGVDPQRGTETAYEPFYSFRHDAPPEARRAFWHATRRPSLRPGDAGTEIALTLVDLDFRPSLPSEPTLVVRTTCTNRDLPDVLRRAGERLAFELEAAAPLEAIACLVPPTPTRRPPGRRRAQWRLISHLSLNHLSISDDTAGRDVLREMLRLYDFTDPEADRRAASVARQAIEGIEAVRSRRVVGRVATKQGPAFVRGVEVTIDFDESKYLGTGLYLFASVLERFLGRLASINAFSQLVARTRRGEAVLKRWPPRSGAQPLV
jgi:type VI secretion system protein ImpG